MDERESTSLLNFYDLLLLVVRWRKLFIVNFLIVAVVSVVVSLSLTKWYTAEAVILPPSSSGGGVPSFLPKELAGVAASFGMERSSEEIYQTFLTSRTLKQRIIDRFNLRDVYEMDEDVFPEDLLWTFESHLKIETREDMAIVVQFEDQSPKRAAEIANACVEELDRLYQETTSRTARNNRIFVERRLKQVNDSLSAIQDSIAQFQKNYNAVSLPEQVKLMIESASNLKAEQLSTEVQLGVLLNTYGENHPLAIQLSHASRELERQYRSVLEGRESRLFPSIAKLPELSRQYADLFRKLRIHASLLEFIYPQYESAKIQEEKETANVQLLDRAMEPNRRTRPTRKVIVITACVVSMVVTLIAVLLIEYWNRLPERNRKDWEKIMQMRKTLFRR